MAEPKVCVSLEGITVDEMIDEANRANIAGADYVEVRFDKLYLIKLNQKLQKMRMARK